ncbi:dTDP-4-dehydrorhamnose reductase [uncultured Algibacter sp.]|uniref:dTDP-4-dehydrorhamnose reductase n=1 Tax=uncultured Algibacter sp. TaxID=298659 RepID=UPI002628276D|nr:dTDP-4-dehydrorhamnose reductase [uncultured Algibacter sp.]
MNTKVLVTGAGGQLGKTIEELYKDNNQGLDFVFVTKKDLDISNNDVLKDFFKTNKFNYCINCAAYTNVEQAEKTPEIAYQINGKSVKYLAEACKENDTILVHISTDYVFDGEKREPYTTDDVTNPINIYGKSKLQGEKYIQDISTDYFIVRTSWLYSKNYGHNFYKTIVSKSKTEKELSITTDQIGCPTDTINLSKFVVDLILQKNERFGVYHFCDKEVLTWFDFAKRILEETNLINKTKLVRASNYVTFARRPRYTVLKGS